MANFWLIQRGKFKEKEPFIPFGLSNIVDLSYMGAAEFEWGAIPKAYRRLMYHFEKYKLFKTGIFSPEGEELMVFCKEEHSSEIIQMIKEYVQHPYSLKEFSELDKIPTAKKTDTSWERRNSDFWWCIDRFSYGNWLACMSSHSQKLIDTLTCDFRNWWQTKSTEERNKEYNNSLDW